MAPESVRSFFTFAIYLFNWPRVVPELTELFRWQTWCNDTQWGEFACAAVQFTLFMKLTVVLLLPNEVSLELHWRQCSWIGADKTWSWEWRLETSQAVALWTVLLARRRKDAGSNFNVIYPHNFVSAWCVQSTARIARLVLTTWTQFMRDEAKICLSRFHFHVRVRNK